MKIKGNVPSVIECDKDCPTFCSLSCDHWDIEGLIEYCNLFDALLKIDQITDSTIRCKKCLKIFKSPMVKRDADL